MKCVLSVGTPLKVFDSVIKSVTILVVDLGKMFGVRYKRYGYKPMHQISVASTQLNIKVSSCASFVSYRLEVSVFASVSFYRSWVVIYSADSAFV